MRLGRIAAPDDLRLGVANIVEAIGHRTIAPGSGNAGHRRRMADASLVVGIVGTPEGSQLTEEISAFISEFRRAEPIDRVGARLLAHCHQLVADLADRLVPADARPLAVNELQRVFEPPFAGDELAHRCTLGAMRTAIDRAVPTRFLPDPYAVGDLGRNRAADRAMRADALADRDLRSRCRWGAGVGLAHAAERQRAERRQSARREA